MKKGIWTPDAKKSFNHIMTKTMSAYILALPNFYRVFKVDCDASHVSIGVVRSQGDHIAYFSEKMNALRLNNSIYDIEFHAIVQALKHGRHYLIQREFVLNFDNKALCYLKS